MEQDKHIVKSYDDEMKEINNNILDIGSLVEHQLKRALSALKNQDTALAEKVTEDDNIIDEKFRELDQNLVLILGKRQPMATDLRTIFSAIKMNKDLERLGDHATNIAKRTAMIELVLPEKPVRDILRMGEHVQIMIGKVIQSFVNFSAEEAKVVWKMDEEIDDEYLGILRQLLTYMMEDPKRISACTNLLYMVKDLERAGDYVQNIAEDIYYAVSGEPLYNEGPDREWEAIKPLKKKK